MTLGWGVLLAVLAGILWLGLRHKPTPKVSPPPAAGPQLPAPPDNPALAKLKHEARTLGNQIDAAWAIEDPTACLSALERAENALRELIARAEADDIEVANGQSQLENIAVMKARCTPIATTTPGAVMVAIVDTETTGLDDQDEPISIGLLLAEYTEDKGELIKEHARLYMLREPSVPIHPKAQAVHGISATELRGKAWDKPTLARALSSASLIAAHNAKFDRRMLARILPFSSELQWACTIHALNREWARTGAPARSLDALCQLFEIERPAPHNALSDALALQSLLTVRTGKTTRSRTLMGALINNPWAPPYDPEH